MRALLNVGLRWTSIRHLVQIVLLVKRRIVEALRVCADCLVKARAHILCSRGCTLILNSGAG